MNVSDLAQSLLDAAVAALAADAPDRQVVTAGAPRDSRQGEQIAVGWVRNYVGVPGLSDGSLTGQCWGAVVAEFQLRVTRCIETSTGVADTDPAVLLAAANRTMDDAQIIRAALASWAPHTVASPGDVWVGTPLGFQPQGFGTGFVLAVHAAT